MTIIDPKSLQDTDVNFSLFVETDPQIEWSMTRNERYCFIQLLQKIKPKVAIEIGTYKGGSLQMISKYATKVYAIDTDPSVKERLEPKFNNVEFLIGDSKSIVPDLIKKIEQRNEELEFVLIDGDHSADGVNRDITNILKHIPQKPLSIILHDSFNPECRKGMKAYNYNKNKHVHYVELDYITGVFEPNELYRQMWGGFAHILLLPEKRTIPLHLNQSQLSLYNHTYLHSIHFFKNIFRFLKPIYRLFKK